MDVADVGVPMAVALPIRLVLVEAGKGSRKNMNSVIVHKGRIAHMRLVSFPSQNIRKLIKQYSVIDYIDQLGFKIHV